MLSTKIQSLREIRLQYHTVCILTVCPAPIFEIRKNPVYLEALTAVEKELSRYGLQWIYRHAGSLEEVKALPRPAADGILMLGARTRQGWPSHMLECPCVTFMGLPAMGWGDTVTYNNVSVGCLAADYLLGKNIRQAAVIGYHDPGQGLFSIRNESFDHRMGKTNAVVYDLTHEEYLMQPGQSTEVNTEMAKYVVAEALELLSSPAGIFVNADIFLPAVYDALEQKGRTPGVDIEVISCNNESKYLANLKRRPAEIAIQSGLIGSEAVDRLLWRIEHPERPSTTLLLEPLLIPVG